MREPLTLLLSRSDGATGWRHDLAPGATRLGWEHVGPRALVGRLGTLLGFPTAPAPAADRVAAYAARLATHDDGTRSYTRSRAKDVYGVATHLLALRDALVSCNWDGRPLAGSARLADLSALERLAAPLPPGYPDILRDLTHALSGTKLPIPLRLHLSMDRDAFPPSLVRLLDALAAAGAEVLDATAPTPVAAAGSDLHAVQQALLTSKSAGPLRGDGSFVMLLADTPLEAAELVASTCHGRDLGPATAYVPCESATLDAALARHGLPTLGLPASSRWRAILQALPLRLALAFAPQDPTAAAQLLALPGGPLHRQTARALLEALQAQPGIGSPAWTDAVNALDAAPQAASHARADVDRWFGGPLHSRSTGLPAARAAALCAIVATWARGQIRRADDPSLYVRAAHVAATLERMLDALPPDTTLRPLELEQLHDAAVGDGTDGAFDLAMSGRPACVTALGQPLSRARDLLWWGFLGGADESPSPSPWTAAERAALVAAAVTPPAPGEARVVEAKLWLRAVLAAGRQLVLARWLLAGTEPTFAHPLQDQLETLFDADSLARCTLTARDALGGKSVGARELRVAASTVALPPATPVRPRDVWRLPPEAVEPTGQLSPTSLEHLFGCPLRWVLEYRAQLRPGRAVSLPEGSLLLGSFAHAILEDMLFADDRLDLARASVDDAERWAVAAFDRRVGLEAAPLVQGGSEVELDRARTLVGKAARALVGVAQRAGLAPVKTEEAVSGSFAGQPVRGFVDLAFERAGRPVVVDLKLGGGAKRRAALERGRALQLAIYASLKKVGGAMPATAFLILQDQEWLTTDDGLPGATKLDGPTMAATLLAAEKGFAYWRKVLGAGVVPRTADDCDWSSAVQAVAGDPPGDGPAAPEPDCGYCDFGDLCRVLVATGGEP